MPLFKEDEWALLLNWHEWNLPTIATDFLKLPPLKFWTDEAALSLLEYGSKQLVLDVSGLRTKRVRLGLKQVKPAQVTGVFPTDKVGGFSIQMAE